MSLLSDTHNSVRFGKQSRFSSTAICCPISVRLWRFGKYSMPMIFGNPEKNISNLVTFFPDSFCSFSNFTPFIVHWQKNNHENYTNKYKLYHNHTSQLTTKKKSFVSAFTPSAIYMYLCEVNKDFESLINMHVSLPNNLEFSHIWNVHAYEHCILHSTTCLSKKFN